MLTINTNLSSLIAQNSLKQSSTKLNTAIERMSTGCKINHAKDNSANYSISTNMTTKMGALQVAEENALQGIDMVNSALSSLAQMSDSVGRLKELSVLLHNDTYGKSSKEAINEEAKSIINDIYRIKNTSNYNNISLFGGIERASSPDFNGSETQSKYKFIENVTRIDTTTLQSVESLDEAVTTTGGTYSVSSPEEIEKALRMVSAGTLVSAEIVLANDVDYSEYTGTHTQAWVSFNGNGYVIKNFTSARAFFGNSSTVKNLGLENVNISSNSDGACTFGNGAINLTNCYATGKVNGKNQVGGLVGQAKGAKVKNCFVDMEVTGDHSVGGIIGYVDSNASCYIENCYSLGYVKGSFNSIGGLVGGFNTRSDMTGVITNCASAAIVEAQSSSGGLIGYVSAPGTKFTMENCYSVGSVEVTGSGAGGLIGALSVTNEIQNCYYLKETSGCSDEGKGVGVDVSELFSLIDRGTLPDYNLDLPMPDIYDDTSDNLYSPASVNFHLGASAESSAGIFIDLTFKMEGLKDICYLGLTHESSLEKMDKMLASIANKETELGSLLNRFESALDEISIQYENLVSSRSTILDADISEVSVSYIQQQILQQASVTLMATANQSPSIALQLI